MTQSHKRTTVKWTVVAAAAALLAVPQMAQADHNSFAYNGPAYGFHGEAQIIKALEQLEIAYGSGLGSHRSLRWATRQAQRAYEVVCHPQARYFLRGAIEHMNEFQYSQNLAHLDDAARLLNRALVVEQRKHDFVRNTAYVGPLRRHYLPYRTSRTYWRPRYPGRRYFGSRSGIYFGGRRGGISISF